MSLLGERLRKARERKKLKQTEVAEKTGINNKTLSRYENGGTEPDTDSLKILAELYEVSIDWLIGSTIEPSQPFTDIEKAFIGGLELTDDEIIKKFPMTYKGRELTEEEKRRVIAVARAVFLSDQDTRKDS